MKVISLKAQHVRLIESTCDMIEEYAKQYFELFDEANYHFNLRVEVDQIRRVQELAQSPFSLLRTMAKKLKYRQSDFSKYIYNGVIERKKEIILQNIKQGHVKAYLNEILKLRWNFKPEGSNPAIFKVSHSKKVSKLKQKRIEKCLQIDEEGSDKENNSQ